MSTFHVELKKTVDDSYEIEVGRALGQKLADDLKGGLMGSLHRFALITDSHVETLYAQPICQKLLDGEGVALTPGSAFCCPGFVRLAYTKDISVLTEAAARLNDEIVRLLEG